MNNSSILSSLFTILNVTVKDNSIKANVAINKDSEIYKAHFPGDPITPGVCQIHLIKDVLNHVFPNIIFNLKTSKQIKFTEALRPSENNKIHVNISTLFKRDILEATAQISNLNKVFLKAKLTYVCEE